MPTECSADLFGFAVVEGRDVVVAFDGGAISSDAGALLLGTADHAIKLTERFAACFHDARRPHLIEHEVATLLGQRVFGIALGYEDLNDHDELRHDPMMAVLAGKLAARRKECAPVAGKSTLNRLELSRLEPTRYHKISHNPIAPACRSAGSSPRPAPARLRSRRSAGRSWPIRTGSARRAPRTRPSAPPARTRCRRAPGCAHAASAGGSARRCASTPRQTHAAHPPDTRRRNA